MGTDSDPDAPDRGAQSIRDDYPEAIETLAGLVGKDPADAAISPSKGGYRVSAEGHSDLVAAADGADAGPFIAEHRDQFIDVAQRFGVHHRRVKVDSAPDGRVRVSVVGVEP